MNYLFTSFVICCMKAFILNLMVQLDVKLYGQIKECKIDKGIAVCSIYQWLFRKSTWQGRESVPRYRVFMTTVKIVMLYWMFSEIQNLHLELGYNMLQLISMFAAYFLMVQEYLYYPFNEQSELISKFQADNADVYWLKHWFFAGKYIFTEGEIGNFTNRYSDHGYRAWKFQYSFYAGCIILFLTSFIH